MAENRNEQTDETAMTVDDKIRVDRELRRRQSVLNHVDDIRAFIDSGQPGLVLSSSRLMVDHLRTCIENLSAMRYGENGPYASEEALNAVKIVCRDIAHDVSDVLDALAVMSWDK